MEMFVMVACMGIFGLAITCIAFAAATGAEQEQTAAEAAPETAKAAEPARFFGDAVIVPAAVPAARETRVPLPALLLQIENHVRLEQAAAESFLAAPTSALLHSRTISAFVR